MFLRTNAKFEPGSVKQNFWRPIWTVCTTCTIFLLNYEGEKTSTIERECSKKKQRKIIKHWLKNLAYMYVMRSTWHKTIQSAKSSSAFAQWLLLTLINVSLSFTFLGIILLSSWIWVQRRKKYWPRFDEISCQKKSATRKSLEG